MINSIPLLEGLRELADATLQEKFWVNGNQDQMSSFTEAMSYVFDDAGIARAVDTGYLQRNFSSALCNKVDELRRLLHQVPENFRPRDIIDHSKMEQIRALAEELMGMFSTELQIDR